MTAEPVWEGAWEVEFPANSPEELALALVIKDLIHGTSFDIERADGGADLAIEYIAGDELDGTTYRLLVTAEATGSPDADLVRDVTERLLDQLVDEEESLVEQRTVLAVEKIEALGFRAVPEDQERWDLVVPDWQTHLFGRKRRATSEVYLSINSKLRRTNIFSLIASLLSIWNWS